MAKRERAEYELRAENRGDGGVNRFVAGMEKARRAVRALAAVAAVGIVVSGLRSAAQAAERLAQKLDDAAKTARSLGVQPRQFAVLAAAAAERGVNQQQLRELVRRGAEFARREGFATARGDQVVDALLAASPALAARDPRERATALRTVFGEEGSLQAARLFTDLPGLQRLLLQVRDQVPAAERFTQGEALVDAIERRQRQRDLLTAQQLPVQISQIDTQTAGTRALRPENAARRIRGFLGRVGGVFQGEEPDPIRRGIERGGFTVGGIQGFDEARVGRAADKLASAADKLDRAADQLGTLR